VPESGFHFKMTEDIFRKNIFSDSSKKLIRIKTLLKPKNTVTEQCWLRIRSMRLYWEVEVRR
jgi:hypothetical protein